MDATVRLRATGTIAPARTFVFRQPAVLVAGRAADCGLRAPDDDRRVSRRHCVFHLDPPTARVSDLGSRNGTYVNGVRLPSHDPRPYELADGDEVRLGGVVVEVFSPVARRTTPTGGDVAPEQYTVLRELGSGAQGTVHLAWHEPSGELRALKVLHPEAAQRPELVHGFLREIRTTRTLSHPHLVAFHEAGSTGTRLYTAHEYCDGGSLDRYVAERGGRLPPEEGVALILQVLRGLTYLHEREADGDGAVRTVPDRLVHRDLTPRNVLLTGARKRPRVKIADFGLAKAFERAGLSGHTVTGALGGSFAFMPRAQIVNYKYAGPPVDVWAAAACLYFALTGATPRDFPAGAEPADVVLRHPVVPVRRRSDAVPRRLAGLVDGVLTDGDGNNQRGMSAKELAQLLQEAT
ncbi:protein kinase domain-containing protein [Streptomyces pseudogriseolus]|uniref:protein kinase domain-containing protein n=1 Tax=Streptomyces pseudogriseolus TaxID=36817 RepID=UPI001CE2F9CD|nr:FHA domain-containing serine/threonine-protein kinase [Streptomyces pseudogriseolus]